MSRIDSPYKNLIASLSELIFNNYEFLDDYFKTSFRLVKESALKVQLKMNEWDNENPNHKYSGFDIYESDFLDLTNFESKTLIAGILILHSEVENTLKFICNSVGQEKGKTTKLKDISGSGTIDRCRKYLEQEFTLDFSSKQNEWNKLLAYNRLRNILTHQNGQISFEPQKQFEQYGDVIQLSSIENITIDNNGIIKISNNQIVFDFLKLSKQLLSDCCDRLKNLET